ncbi:MAG TPA: hypothetical protein VNP36_06585 [Burkholderiales bacterium]|nr:hypothetical protein [Burkholderiales bacterium]
MDGATVFRLISLIPDRMARSQSGSPFDGATSERAGVLARFLGWLGPLSPIGKEEQQLLGVRAGNGKSLAEGAEGEEPLDLAELADEPEGEDQPVRLPGAGTQIAA